MGMSSTFGILVTAVGFVTNGKLGETALENICYVGISAGANRANKCMP